MKNVIKIKLTEFGGIQVLCIPFKLYKDSYNTTNIECLLPKREHVKSLLKMYASSRDSLGNRVWTSQTYNLVYEKDIQQNQESFELYKTSLPQEFCKNVGHIELTFAYSTLNAQDTVEQLLTSGTIHLYIDGIGNNNAGVAISPYDSTASKVNALVKEMKIEQEKVASDIPISKAERLPYDNVQDMLNGLNTNKVDKLQVEAGKLLLSNGNGGIQASDVGIQEYENQKGYIDQLHSEQESRMDSMQQEITANTVARHTHANQALLESYTVPNSEILECVQKMHEHANKEILDSITEAFTTALKGNVESSLTNVEIDSNTGIFTFTKHNGEKVTVDTLLEKVIVNFEFNAERKALILISEDGTRQEIELGALLSMYNGTDGAEIAVTIDRVNNIGASIKAGAVTTSKLADNIVDKLSQIVPAREIVDLIYPIGIILEFGEEFDPNIKWDFTKWERLENCFTYASGTKRVGDVGGEEEHKLTVEELAEHGHNNNTWATTMRMWDLAFSTNGGWEGVEVARTWSGGLMGMNRGKVLDFSYNPNVGVNIHNTGGNKPHNNMPPYRVVAKWMRRA